MTEILRTPPERFATVPGFPYQAHARTDLPGYAGLSMAYVDEGPTGAPVFLCLHGQPTWSYLYRRMIPHFLAAGGRVVAPDFFGFGRSDKPAEEAVYTFDFHRNSLLAFVNALDLKNVTLVVQDWGGLLGLTLPMEMPQRFHRLIVMNTGLGTGDFSPKFPRFPSEPWGGEQVFSSKAIRAYGYVSHHIADTNRMDTIIKAATMVSSPSIRISWAAWQRDIKASLKK